MFYYCHGRSCSGAPVREFVLIGMLGAFTTFSTFSLETVDLLMEGNKVLGAANVAANVGFCVLGIVAARLLGQLIWG